MPPDPPGPSTLRVLSLGSDLAAGYCARLLADTGAEVVRIEDGSGDPLRGWSASGSANGDGALFQYLAEGMTSVVVEDADSLIPVLQGADIVLWTPHSLMAQHFTPARIREIAPHAVVTAITPFGLTGPWADRPATDLTLQAMSGGVGQRGLSNRPPLRAGGRLGDWMAGMFAAVHSLAANYGGGGELLDVSTLESLVLSTVVHPVSWFTIAGFPLRPIRMRNLPDIHPTKDGHVGFMVVTGQQWLDFCVLVERPDWGDDPELGLMAKRVARRDELVAAIDAWCAQRTNAEVLELADLLRVPAAVVGDGPTIPTMDHLVERNAFVRNKRDGFLQPAIPWRLHGVPVPIHEAAPTLGSGVLPQWQPVQSGGLRGRPFTGLRVADFTANWAGPIVGHVLALLGAEVIHVEGGRRPDAIRNNTCKPMSDPDWPEFSGLFAGINTGKRSVTVDMSSEDGQRIARELIATCDVVVENYTPRVMESWGLDWEQVHAINPRAVMVRMPAYGLDGPWRDRGGYAQTMEMFSGMAATTGWLDSTPEIPNGPCDPIAGSHATIALLTALRRVRETGDGILVESPMIAAALNVAAEVVIEQSAYGVTLQRQGNRSRQGAPQGIYPTSDPDRVGLGDSRWVALAVSTDEQWAALCDALGEPAWTQWTESSRWERHDEIDATITAWTAASTVDDVVRTLRHAGVPVGEVVLAHLLTEVQQLQHRGFFEDIEHPLTGNNTHAGLPVRWSSIPAPVQRGPAPLLGGDDDLVWLEQVGLPPEDYQRLRKAGVIGRGEIHGRAW
jgi:crotonobetainyl-CoA:carnitine CoA-transferase CaiB-like acyl-CoA transferase